MAAGTFTVAGPGISFGDQAGISLYTAREQGIVSTLVPKSPLFFNDGAPYFMGYVTAPAYPGQPAAAEESTAALNNDLGPSFFAGSGPAIAPSTSLGEVAARWKARRPHSVRIYTNADVDRLPNLLSGP
jgi:hypothetical protein